LSWAAAEALDLCMNSRVTCGALTAIVVHMSDKCCIAFLSLPVFPSLHPGVDHILTRVSVAPLPDLAADSTTPTWAYDKPLQTPYGHVTAR
jgi:hypothetical protein